MKNIIFFFLIIFIVPAIGQKTNVQKVDAYLKEYQEKIPIPGFSIAIVEEGKIVFQKGYGVEKEGSKKAMTTHSSLGIGSLGRGFTAVGMMQLVEKGKVDLDAPVIQYLPWFKTANKNFSDQITVRMCLSNTSAVPAQFEAVPSLDPDQSLAKFVRSLEGYYVKRQPGLAYEFSEEGYSIAGLIISELSGMTYSDYVEKNIFQPLKMTHTTTKPSRFQELNVLYGHEMALSNFIPAERGTIDGNFFPSGSEMKSSASDFANFMLMLLQEGQFNGQTFLQTKSVQEIFKSNISFQGLGTMLGGNGIDIQCGLSWLEMNIENRTIYVQVGNTGTTAAIAGLSRENKQGVVLLFNGDVNRLDRFVYPTLENTVNNVIHILNGEKTTDFAITRFDDPFEDEDFVLPKADWSKYMGEYFPFGKESPFFKDMNIHIYEGKNGDIELKAFNNKVLKGHYILQFTSESRAALRNIAQPREIQFKIFPNGSIGGLFMFGTEYKKRDPALAEQFELVKIDQPAHANNLSFLLPKGVTANWGGKEYIATFPKKEGITFRLIPLNLTNNSFEKFVENATQNDKVTIKGNVLTKNLRGGIWSEQTLYTKASTGLQQYLFFTYQDPIMEQEIQGILSHPYGKFNTEIQEILMYFQRSITFGSNTP